eukprot:TRINITY_DN1365_c0_g1_i6.p1 TRINITY_DN1365_c0_g1~~TRINITY_DN1365_c0_g1_i6.p1  ORF type:complete len:175 (-),score=33.59 TRINITY_DN1365_c0_g1_i6:305-790(-)
MSASVSQKRPCLHPRQSQEKLDEGDGHEQSQAATSLSPIITMEDEVLQVSEDLLGRYFDQERQRELSNVFAEKGLVLRFNTPLKWNIDHPYNQSGVALCKGEDVKMLQVLLVKQKRSIGFMNWMYMLAKCDPVSSVSVSPLPDPEFDAPLPRSAAVSCTCE